MNRTGAWSVMLAVAVGAIGCGGAAIGARSQLAEMERVRQGPAARDARELAPQAFGAAEAERTFANKASADGDQVAAGLHAERAVAGYTHAFVLARLARATREEADASAALARAQEDARQLVAARVSIEREGDELDKQLKVAREAVAPAPSGPADPQREAARLVAARSLAMQARLLCGAARLVRNDVAGLADAEHKVDELDKALEAGGGAGGAAIDRAARARAGCLGLLAKAKRDAAPGAAADRSDALLAELSAASGTGRTGAKAEASDGWEPSRDERGVVVTLRGLFKGAALLPEGEAKLKELGRIAAAHPGFALQVVVHDEVASATERAADVRRGEACTGALAAGGASADRIRVELAGARAPIVDPRDTAHRSRNARVEIVFIAPGG